MSNYNRVKIRELLSTFHDTRATVLRINKYFEHTAGFRWFF